MICVSQTFGVFHDDTYSIVEDQRLTLMKVQDPNEPGFYRQIYSDMLASEILWFSY